MALRDVRARASGDESSGAGGGTFMGRGSGSGHELEVQRHEWLRTTRLAADEALAAHCRRTAAASRLQAAARALVH